ncbi:MAG TPA: hypothetical protein VHB49_05520 [Bradyrhizobium sp.]|nr:hypothetical protein [Bradyrhizobium sp.]
MLIARRADTKARTDFATWKMMAKLNGASALPTEAQNFLASYKGLLDGMPETQATEATINLMYRTYYAEMGGHGTPPDIQSQPKEPVMDNVTAFRRPTPQRSKNKTGPDGRPRLPVALIFMCLVVVYVGFRYLWR